MTTYIYLFIIFFIRHILYPATVGSARNNAKETQEGKNEEKMDHGRRQNHSPQPRQLMNIRGKKKRAEKQKEEQKKNISIILNLYIRKINGFLKVPTTGRKYINSLTPS